MANTRTPATIASKRFAGREHWEVRGVRDSVKFFRALGSLLPEATTLVLEGQDIARDVRDALSPYLEFEATAVTAGVGWPDWRFSLRYRFSAELAALLAHLAAHHAEPELCRHLFASRYSEPLLEWYDAFDHEMLIAAEIPALRVRLFCHRLGATFRRVAPAG